MSTKGECTGFQFQESGEVFESLDNRPQHQPTPRWWPQRHPSSERLHGLLKEMGELHDRKQRDYGTIKDPFANVRGSEDFGVKPWVGAMIRLNDKVKRLQSHAQGSPLANEGALDSFMDIAVYALIAYVLYEQQEIGGGHVNSRRERATPSSTG